MTAVSPEKSSVPENVANPTAEEVAPTPPPWLEKIRAIRHRLPLIIRLPLALVFLAIGIAAGFIPILQGWMFVLAAFWLIFPNQAEQLVEKIKNWFAGFKNKRKM